MAPALTSGLSAAGICSRQATSPQGPNGPKHLDVVSWRKPLSITLATKNFNQIIKQHINRLFKVEKPLVVSETRNLCSQARWFCQAQYEYGDYIWKGIWTASERKRWPKGLYVMLFVQNTRAAPKGQKGLCRIVQQQQQHHHYTVKRLTEFIAPTSATCGVGMLPSSIYGNNKTKRR